jgi:hypothetical protein
LVEGHGEPKTGNVKHNIQISDCGMLTGEIGEENEKRKLKE